MRPLTPKQQLFFDIYREYFSEHNCPPTYNYMMDELRFRSPNSVTQNLAILKNKSWLSQEGVPLSYCPFCCQSMGNTEERLAA